MSVLLYSCLISLLAFVAAAMTPDPARSETRPGLVLVVHGGAGTVARSTMTPEKSQAYHAALKLALETGYKILAAGGTSLDAVEAAVCILEDDPLFNAGRGAVFTSDGHNELDASIMDGRTLNAGAVASVRGIKNPVKAARRVMEKTSHVMLVGEGAVQFAREQGLEIEDSAYFHVDERWQELKRTQEDEKKRQKEHGSLSLPNTHLGTAGAIALDRDGNLAAATSTGGLTNKRWGRVGDAPIIGAGTYADNAVCAVSCTGRGEFFIRGSYAHEIASLMKYKSMSLDAAAKNVIHEQLVSMGGKDTGGLIALDRLGNVAMECNTSGMYRGVIRADGVPQTYIYRDE